MVVQETFRLGALHIDETVAYNESEGMARQRTSAVQSTVAGINESMPFHSALLEDALPSDEENGDEPTTVRRRHQLQELVTASLSCLSSHCYDDLPPCNELVTRMSEADATLLRKSSESACANLVVA